MIKLFRSIQPIIFIFLILYFLMLCGMYLIYVPTGALDHELFDIWRDLGAYVLQASPILLLLLGIGLVLYQAMVLNRTTNGIRLFEVTNFLTALSFVTIYLFFASWISMNEIMLASFFILLVMVRIFKIYGKEYALLDSFDIGLLIGIASLLYAPAIWFIPASLLGINTVKRLKGKEVLMIFLGWFTPVFLFFTPLFWFDSSAEFFRHHFNLDFINQIPDLYSQPEFVIKWVTLSILTIVSGILIMSKRMQKVNRFRKTFQVVFVFLLFSLVSLFFVPDHALKHLSILILPISLYTAFLINEYSKSWIAEVIHLVMLFVILFFQFQRFI